MTPVGATVPARVTPDNVNTPTLVGSTSADRVAPGRTGSVKCDPNARSTKHARQQSRAARSGPKAGACASTRPAPQAPLGKLRKFSDARPLTSADEVAQRDAVEHRHESQERRRWLHDFLRGEGVSTLPGVRHCGISPKFGATSAGLQLRHRADGSRSARLVDVQRCRSQHGCPECAAEVGAEMTLELQRAVRHVIEQKGSVLHVALTVQHGRLDELRDTWDALQGGWGHMVDSRDWDDVRKYGAEIGVQIALVRRDRTLRKRERDAEIARLRASAPAGVGLITYVRAVEATWAQTNGWHPHLHVLLFFREQVSAETARLLRDLMYGRYLDGLEKRGFTASPSRGIKVEIATTRRRADQVLGAYLNKVALEVGRPDLKRPKTVRLERNGQLTEATTERWAPFGILAVVATGERPELLRIWQQWEQGSKGRQRVTHGAGWYELLEQAPEIESPDDVVPGDLVDAAGSSTPAPSDTVAWPLSDHGIVAKHRTELLTLGERHGWTPLLARLDELGVHWHWRMPVVDDGLPGACPGTTERTAEHAAGTCSCWVVPF